jgi:hypothetical protein
VDFTIRCYNRIKHPLEVIHEPESEPEEVPFKDDKIEEAVEKLRENEVTEEQLKAFDE